MLLSPPPMVDINGKWEDILKRLYEVFERDFKKSKTYHKEDVVVYDNNVKSDGKGMEEGFWHVITKDTRDKKTREVIERLFEPRRAERLSWAKPLIENHRAKNVKYWNYDKGTKDKGIRTYIWLEDEDFLVVLQRRKNCYFWITSMYVNSQKNRDELLREYYQRV